MLHTTNYNLNKIELADAPPDITVLNKNWDTLDAKLKTCSDADAIQEGHRTDANVHLGPGERLAWNGKADGNHKHDALYAPITHSNNGDAHVLASDKVAWNGKANGIHNHTAEDITGGVVGVDHGGTGKSSLTQGAFLKGNGTNALISESPQSARNSMGLGYTLGALPIANGGTGGVGANDARLNLGAAPSGYGVGEHVYTNSILNPLDLSLKTGVYGFTTYQGTVYNSPLTNMLGHIEVYAVSNEWHYVRAVDHESSLAFINRYSGNEKRWSGWREVGYAKAAYGAQWINTGSGTYTFQLGAYYGALIISTGIATGANGTTNKALVMPPLIAQDQWLDLVVTTNASIQVAFKGTYFLVKALNLSQSAFISWAALCE